MVSRVILGVPDVVTATTNVGHLSRFAPAELWDEKGDRHQIWQNWEFWVKLVNAKIIAIRPQIT